MIMLTEIPQQVETTDGLVIDLAWYQGFEVFVAQELKAKVAGASNKGIDVYDSLLYPGLTVQVKAAHKGKYRNVGNGRFTFSLIVTDTQADVYVLFGVKDEQVYPFVLSRADWEERSSRGKDREVMIFSSSRFARYHPNQVEPTESRFWRDFYVDWPIGLHWLVERLDI